MDDVYIDLNIGEQIKTVMLAKGFSACQLAAQIPCERSNVYNIFKRKNIGVDLLFRIGQVLDHDFFAELSTSFQQQQQA